MAGSEIGGLSRCTVCVLTYNRVEQLAETIANLRNQFGDDSVRTIVVNNGSTDTTAELLDALSNDWPQLIVINSKTNVGCALGRELAWSKADTEYVLSLDDDIIIDRRGLLGMVRVMQSGDKVGLVSPLIWDSVTNRVLNPVVGDPFRATFFYEGCFLLKASLVNAIGYLDPILAIAGEGLDYSIRARKAGFYIARAVEVRVEHVDRERNLDEIAARRQQWLWSFVYLYWKNYSPPSALFLSAKILAAQVLSGYKVLGFRFCTTLFKYVVLGALQGRRVRFSSSVKGRM